MNAQRAQLGEREIGNAIMAIGTFALWINRGDVGDVVEVTVVDDDRLVIFRDDDILLDQVSSQAMRERDGGESMFGEITTCATVCDYEGGSSAGALAILSGQASSGTRRRVGGLFSAERSVGDVYEAEHKEDRG